VSRRALLLLAGLAALAPVPAAAQDALVRAVVDSETLVRILPVSGAAARGRLMAPLAPSSEAISICAGRGARCTHPADSASVRQLQVASVSRIEVAHGTHSGIGAAIGGAFGLGFGLLASAATDACVESGCGGPSATAVLGGSILVFSLIGALIGGSVPAWGPPP